VSTYSRRINQGLGYLDDVEEEDPEAMDMSGWMSRSPTVKTRPRQRKNPSELGGHTPEHTSNDQPGYHDVGYAPQLVADNPGPVSPLNPLWAHDDGFMPKVAVFSKTTGMLMAVLGTTAALAVRDFGGRAGGTVMLGTGMYIIPALGLKKGLISNISGTGWKLATGGIAHAGGLAMLYLGARRIRNGGN
tara:strand:+ start:45 stop:611 length:567 start_codon:yes stop_codon:yes gene_type:complete